MPLLELIVGLLLSAVALAWIARQLHVPYPVALVCGGTALGFVPELPRLTLDPELVLAVFLPPVLYAAALTTSWRDFKHWLRPIVTLATGLVLATTIGVAVVLHLLLPHLPWAVAFAFGAIVSPPDAVAATAILQRLNMPRRLTAILEGESLVNDASGLVLYKFALAAAVSGTFSFVDATRDFVWIVAAGIGLGLLLGRAFVDIQRRLGDPFVQVLLALTLPYVAYLAAEKIGASGVLAVVTAGLVRARFAPETFTPETRILTITLWGVIVFLLNSLIFIFIGLQMRPLLVGISHHTAIEVMQYAAAVTAVAVVVRVLWVFPGTALSRVLSRRSHDLEPPASWKEAVITGWCGMRGLVSLAAALALPQVLASGAHFPERHLLIVLAFVFIATTLVLQGLTLAPLIRWLQIGPDKTQGNEEIEARAAMAHAALAEVNRLATEAAYPEQYVAFLRYIYGTRLSALKPLAEGDNVPDSLSEITGLRMAALAAERAQLVRLWRSNQVGDDVLHRLEAELDLEQTRLQKMSEAAAGR